MARKFKHDSDELIELVKQYIASEGAVKIVYQSLVEFATQQIAYQDVNYQTFSRNPKVKQFIADYNDSLQEKLLDIDRKMYLSSETFIDSRMFLNKSNEEIQIIVSDFNKRLSLIYDQFHRNQTKIIRLNRELKDTKSEMKRKDGEYNVLLLENVELKNRVDALERQLKSEIDKTKHMKRFFDEQIVNPNLLKHLSVNGWTSLKVEGDILESNLLNRSLEEVVTDDSSNIEINESNGTPLSDTDFEYLTKLYKLSGDKNDE